MNKMSNEFIGISENQSTTVYKSIYSTEYADIDFKNLSLREALSIKKKRPVLAEFLVYKEYADGFYCGAYSRVLNIIGKKVFVKTLCAKAITVKGNAIYGDISKMNIFTPYTLDMIRLVCTQRKTEWFTNMIDNHSTIAGTINKTMLKAVFTGKVTSEESYFKLLKKTSYKVNISWKLLRAYFSNRLYSRINLFTLNDFCTNPELLLSRVIGMGVNDIALIADTLDSAQMLEEKISGNWSINRYKAEHQRQIEELNILALGATSDDFIYRELDILKIKDCTHRILLTERDIAKTAMHYHNCVYSNYYEKIANGRYVAIEFKFPGVKPILAGINIDRNFHYNNDYAHIDQIKYPHNLPVESEITSIISRWVADNEDDILKLVSHVDAPNKSKKIYDDGIFYMDAPF